MGAGFCMQQPTKNQRIPALLSAKKGEPLTQRINAIYTDTIARKRLLRSLGMGRSQKLSQKVRQSGKPKVESICAYPSSGYASWILVANSMGRLNSISDHPLYAKRPLRLSSSIPSPAGWVTKPNVT